MSNEKLAEAIVRSGGDEVRPTQHWWERMRVVAFLLGYSAMAEYVQPTPFIQSRMGQLVYFLILFFIGKELFRVREEKSARFYKKTQRWRAKWDKFKDRFGDYTKYRIGRFVRFLFLMYAFGWMLDGLTNRCSGAIQCAFLAPKMLIENLPTILQVAVFIAIGLMQIFLMMYMMAKSDLAEILLPGSIETRFSDVYGQDTPLNRVQENLDMLERPDLIEKKGGYMPGGLLLWGPPGTGKTLMAEAFAGETGKPFVLVPPGFAANMFMGVPILKVKMLFRLLRKLSLKYGGVVCVAPETKVLTDDLRWVRADTLSPGQGIFGVDEEGKREHGGRRTRLGVVEAVDTRTAPRYKIITDRGEIVVTEEHPFLTREYPLETPSRHGALVWKSIEGEEYERNFKDGRRRNILEVGDHIKWLAEPWESEDGDSWLAGMYDGEGHITSRNHKGEGRGVNIGISQNEGTIEERIRSELLERGFDPSRYTQERDSATLINYELTNLADSLQLLGQVRPQRLLESYRETWSNPDPPRLPNSSWAVVQSIEPLDVGPVVTIQTSTRTFIANGFVTHNCFLDEIDSLGNRGAQVAEQFEGCVVDSSLETDIEKVYVNPGGSGGGQGVLEIFLAEMSGLEKPKGLYNKLRKLVGFDPVPPPKYRILFIGATNLPQRLDPALLRPGRFDRKIHVGYPDEDGRYETFEGYLDRVKHELDEDQIRTLAKENPKATGASIKDVVNEALIRALREDREVIEWDDIRDALIWKNLGDEEGRQPYEEDQWRVAIHEGAHAVAAHHFLPKHQIQFASVVRRGSTLGVVSHIPLDERFTQLKSELIGRMKVSLASHVAERIFFDDDVSTGPSSDLKNATNIAMNMVTRFAMEPDFLAVFPEDYKPDGEVMAELLERSNEIVQRTYDELWDHLYVRRDQVELVAKLLDEHDTIDGERIHELLERMEVDH